MPDQGRAPSGIYIGCAGWSLRAEHKELTAGVREFPEQLNPIIARVAAGNRLAIAGVQSMPAMTKLIHATAGINHKGYVLKTA